MSTENNALVIESVQQRDEQLDFDRVEHLRKQRVRDGFERLVTDAIPEAITDRHRWEFGVRRDSYQQREQLEQQHD